MKKGFLKNFLKFTEKHLCQSFFNKVAGMRPEDPEKRSERKETLAQVFSSEFCEVFKNNFRTTASVW